ncbi:MAG: hypothetical protein QUV05_17855 [Phycisphaerae bacterium]|nr:hypothetical protein [Phycisphaerae bacterium]
MPRMVRARFEDPESSLPPGKAQQPGDASSLPAPLLQHPAVGGSIVLVAAAGMQMVVWLVGLRLPTPRPVPPSSLVAHGLLYDLIGEALAGHGMEATEVTSILFVANLLLAMLSGIAWYGIGRLGLGPKWGLWVGLFWVVHPSFSFLANQADQLNAMIALVAAAWCVLLWWRRSRRAGAAVLLGLLAALILTIGPQSLIFLAIALLAMLFSTRGANGGRAAGAFVALTAFLVGTTLLAAAVALPRLSRALTESPDKNEVTPSHSQSPPAWPHTACRLAAGVPQPQDALRLRMVLRFFLIRDRLLDDLTRITARIDADLWSTLDDASGSHIADAAVIASPLGTASRPPAARFLIEQCRVAPAQTLAWLGERMWKSVYATRHRRVHYPFILLQFLWSIPAFWGLWIAVRYRPWRWLALTGGLFSCCQWVLVAVADPLARNLVPVGGFVVLFALVGITDVYERFFGRRLTAPAPASRPARLKRIQRNLNGGTGD